MSFESRYLRFPSESAQIDSRAHCSSLSLFSLSLSFVCVSSFPLLLSSPLLLSLAHKFHHHVLASFAFTPTSTIQIPLFTLLNKPLRLRIVCASAFWTSSESSGFSQPPEIHQLQNPLGPKHSVPTPPSGNIKNHSRFGRGEVSQPMVRAFG